MKHTNCGLFVLWLKDFDYVLYLHHPTHTTPKQRNKMKIKLLALCTALVLAACDNPTATSDNRSQANPGQTNASSSSQQSSSSVANATSSQGGVVTQSSSSTTYVPVSSSSTVVVSYPISADVTYNAGSEKTYGKFYIGATVINSGAQPIKIISGSYAIYGSSGYMLNDIVKTSDNSVFGLWIQPGQSYSFMMDGYSQGYVPFSWAYSLTFSDGTKTVTNKYSGIFTVYLNRQMPK